MTESTRAIVMAMADAVRREASAREAAATATTEAKEAAQLQLVLLGQLQADGLTTAQASHLVSVALGQPLDGKGRSRMGARFRKRRQRSRRAAG
jgi:hypothetical protein